MIPVNRGLATEADDPKYARIEFERRWLVDATARPALPQASVTLIRDRYISGTRLRLRRMERRSRDEIVWKLTKKYECADPSERPIVTTYLTEAEYNVLCMLPALEMTKRRLHTEHDGNWWSVDLFDGALKGLEIAESEADDTFSLAALSPPPWVLREVTDLAQWQGGALAAHGIPED